MGGGIVSPRRHNETTPATRQRPGAWPNPHPKRIDVFERTRCTNVDPDTGCDCDGPVTAGTPVSLCDVHVKLAFKHYLDTRAETDIAEAPSTESLIRRWEDAIAEARTAYPGLLADIQARNARDSQEWHETTWDSHVVYYLRFGDKVKIGTTSNLTRRLREVPHEEVLAVEQGNITLEEMRHEEFAALRVHNRSEWFRATEELLVHCQMLRSHYPDLQVQRRGKLAS